MNCKDCPNNCLGNEMPLNCIYDEETGESLISILSKLKSQPSSVSSSTNYTSDNIVSKSLVRNTSYICASQIVKRDFSYSIEKSSNSINLGWDFLEVMTSLPSNFKLALIKVRVIGSNTGSNLITESKSPSAGISINLSNFPITLDISVRITSPCGDVDMSSIIKISNPTEAGIFRTIFEVKDLNPQTGNINLTQQLNSIESQLVSSKLEINTLRSLIDELKTEIENLKANS